MNEEEQDDLAAQRPLRDGREAKQADDTAAIRVASGCPLRDATTADLDQHPLSYADEADEGYRRVQAHWAWVQRLWPGMTWRDWHARQDGEDNDPAISASASD